MVGWHHWLDGNEFEQAPGVGDRPGSLLQFMGLQSQTRLSNWIELNWAEYYIIIRKSRTQGSHTDIYTYIQIYANISKKYYTIILLALQIISILDMLNNYKLNNEKQDIILNNIKLIHFIMFSVTCITRCIL